MGDSESKNGDSDISDANEFDEIEIKYFNHIEELKKTKIEGHCLLKKALIKYMMQNDTDSEREKYTYEDYLDKCKTHWGSLSKSTW